MSVSPTAAIDTAAARAEVEALLASGTLDVVFHSVVRLENGDLLGTEALARMPAHPERHPRAWFDLAAEAGMSVELEAAAAVRALGYVGRVPGEGLLFVNASPLVAMSDAFQDVLPEELAHRIVLDIPADASVPSYRELGAVVSAYRDAGVRISVDDAGDDRGSWSRINHLEPEIIKLAPSITRRLLTDSAARTAASHFLAFAADIHADVIAEAVETDAEREVLVDLGVRFGQGFLWGRPAPLT